MSETCGAVKGILKCDLEPTHLGPHRGYWEEHDAVLFWDETCQHGLAWDMHCCDCHSGFLFFPEYCTCGEGA